MKSILIVGTILFAIAFACGDKESSSTTQNKPGSSPATKAEPPIEVKATELTKMYDSNELAADELYSGKKLAVTGTITNIAETLGNVTVSLKGHDMIINVMCSFPESEKSNVSRLGKGQTTRLTGTGDGMTAGLYVGLKDCAVAAK